MRINTNVSSLTAQEAAVNTNKNISSSLEKLSSGLKINKAADDASGLAIADKLRTQTTSINQGISNGNSAVALLQIADKSMAEQSTILDTIKSKLIQANTATTSDDGRTAIAKDVTKLLEQLNNIAEQTNYNGTNLLQKARTSSTLTGVRSASTGLTFQIGEGTADLIKTKTIQANVQGYKLTTLATAVKNGAAVTAGASAGVTARFSRAEASAGQKAIDAAITQLNGYRGDIGSTQNQVESAIRNLTTQATNIKNAESVIRDVDYAQESANYNKLNIIAQAGSYAISQANSTQQNVLRLLQ
ncbi:flagellin N-terminal helical domain-containing protein [Aliarcobacter butzleri]|uniref:flagellin N-terminal helical domain-containing protein n=1 Tax=Aliarcobacter butzleri TaxID=28197 RepID=UPI001587577A|nr:flagellin [Aliarcobacter butzleri]MCT7597943.1 flagellin [Aliarcobacter butzleri]MDK2083432.1 flagellin [Aliarcobacter butzleri]MDN5074645.1 flagellin [Aliarcobacter butzleri]MDN5116208.1 flagellin [Aliarcobacter butzleri]NUW28477.1 flagellin [Aliarcobacter butzleri]